MTKYTYNSVYKFPHRTIEIAHSTTYKDSAGNLLVIEEGHGEEIVETDRDVQDYLNDWGYDGPNDWIIE